MWISQVSAGRAETSPFSSDTDWSTRDAPESQERKFLFLPFWPHHWSVGSKRPRARRAGSRLVTADGTSACGAGAVLDLCRARDRVARGVECVADDAPEGEDDDDDHRSDGGDEKAVLDSACASLIAWPALVAGGRCPHAHLPADVGRVKKLWGR